MAEGVADALGTQLLIAAVYDRDYFCDNEIDDVLRQLRTSLKLAHVHSKKEIENYSIERFNEHGWNVRRKELRWGARRSQRWRC